MHDASRTINHRRCQVNGGAKHSLIAGQFAGCATNWPNGFAQGGGRRGEHLLPPRPVRIALKFEIEIKFKSKLLWPRWRRAHYFEGREETLRRLQPAIGSRFGRGRSTLCLDLALAWRRLRRLHPSYLQPTRRKNHITVLPVLPVAANSNLANSAPKLQRTTARPKLFSSADKAEARASEL